MGASWSSRNNKLTDETDADLEDPRQSACLTVETHDDAPFKVLEKAKDDAGAVEPSEFPEPPDADVVLARSCQPEKMLKMHLTGHLTVFVSRTGDVVVQKGHR